MQPAPVPSWLDSSQSDIVVVNVNGVFTNVLCRPSDRISRQDNEFRCKPHNGGVSANSGSKNEPWNRFATVSINGPNHRGCLKLPYPQRTRNAASAHRAHIEHT